MDAFEGKKLNIKSIVFIAVMSVLCAAVCVLLFCLNITPKLAVERCNLLTSSGRCKRQPAIV